MKVMNMESPDVPIDHTFLEEIKQMLRQARQGVLHQVNAIMVKTYFEIGQRIVEQEQNGHDQAVYGSYLLETLSGTLSKEFGKGFSKRNLELIRKFYLTYRIAKSPISQSLSWTHYLHLMRIEDEAERSFYELETVSSNWSVRELSRQIDSALYQRLALSTDKEKVKLLSQKGHILERTSDAIKDPYILEFVGLPVHSAYSETELEQALIDKLEHFLLELGKGFAFVGRQVRFTFDEENFRTNRLSIISPVFL